MRLYDYGIQKHVNSKRFTPETVSEELEIFISDLMNNLSLHARCEKCNKILLCKCGNEAVEKFIEEHHDMLVEQISDDSFAQLDDLTWARIKGTEYVHVCPRCRKAECSYYY